jgi:hypothetical protein
MMIVPDVAGNRPNSISRLAVVKITLEQIIILGSCGR